MSENKKANSCLSVITEPFVLAAAGSMLGNVFSILQVGNCGYY